MKSSVSLSSFFFLLAVILVFLVPLIQGDLIDQTCERTPYYDLCVSSLLSNPQSSGAEVKGLASIMANITLSNATDTLNYIQGLINQITDPGLERGLAYCAETYIALVKYVLPQSIDAVTKGQYKFANYGISYASKEADICEKRFSGSIKSPLTDRNQLVHKLCDVSVAIINILIKG